MSREKDISLLIKACVDIDSTYEYNLDHQDRISCPFCYCYLETHYDLNEGMNDITHGDECAYLIAKDLNTK